MKPYIQQSSKIHQLGLHWDFLHQNLTNMYAWCYALSRDCLVQKAKYVFNALLDWFFRVLFKGLGSCRQSEFWARWLLNEARRDNVQMTYESCGWMLINELHSFLKHKKILPLVHSLWKYFYFNCHKFYLLWRQKKQFLSQLYLHMEATLSK